jgi:hypothetical protein
MFSVSVSMCNFCSDTSMIGARKQHFKQNDVVICKPDLAETVEIICSNHI